MHVSLSTVCQESLMSALQVHQQFCELTKAKLWFSCCMLLLCPDGLPMLPCNLHWSQVAREVLQHLAAVTGGELDGFEPEIDLEDLLETYGLSLPDCRECESLHIQYH